MQDYASVGSALDCAGDNDKPMCISSRTNARAGRKSFRPGFQGKQGCGILGAWFLDSKESEPYKNNTGEKKHARGCVETFEFFKCVASASLSHDK